MYLPIAFIYNRIGIVERIRYLYIAGYPDVNYNECTIPRLTGDITSSSRLVELPIDKAKDLILATRGITNKESAAKIELHGYATAIDANGVIREDRTQLLIPDMHSQSPDTLVYAIDYKGNIFKLTTSQVLALVDARKLRLGNALPTKSRAISGAREFTLLGSPNLEEASDYNGWDTRTLLCPEYNLYKGELDAHSTIQGLSKSYTEEYRLDAYTDVPSTVLLLPEGIGDVFIEGPSLPTGDPDEEPVYQNGPIKLKTIVCPEMTRSLVCSLEANNLDSFEAPKSVFGKFCFICYSAKKYTLPERVFPLKQSDCILSNSVPLTDYTLKVANYDAQTLNLRHKVYDYDLDIIDAPNLVSCDIQPCRCRNTTSSISIHNSPKLTRVSFGYKRAKNRPEPDILTALEYALSLELVLNVQQSTLFIDLPTMMNKLSLTLRGLDNTKTVIIQHEGIKDCVVHLGAPSLRKQVIFQRIQSGQQYEDFKDVASLMQNKSEDEIAVAWNNPDKIRYTQKGRD